MKAFLGFAGFVPVLFIAACSSVGTGGNGAQDAGGGDVGGQGGAPLSGELTIQNLNVTVDKIDGRVNLTFVLDNGTAGELDKCNNGSLSTSSGDEALVDPDQYGECGGFDPMEPDTVAAFCADSAYSSICDYGLGSGSQSQLLTVRGDSDATSAHPWEAVGTEYTLTLEFVTTEGEILQTTATATVVE